MAFCHHRRINSLIIQKLWTQKELGIQLFSMNEVPTLCLMDQD